jgi:hypothetical protein
VGAVGGALLLAALAGWKCPSISNPQEQTTDGLLAQETLVTWSALICAASIAFVPYAFSMDFVFMLPGFILAIGAWLRRNRYWQIYYPRLVDSRILDCCREALLLG